MWFIDGIQRYKGLWWMGLGLLWIMAWYELNLELLRAKLAPHVYGWIVISKALVTTFFSIWMITVDMGAYGLLLGVMTGMLLPLIFILRENWKEVRIPQIDRTIYQQLVMYGFPLTITLSLHFVIVSSDRIMLGWLKGTTEAGIYAVAYDLTQQTLLLIMVIVNLAGFPLVVRTLESGKITETKKQLHRYTTTFFMLSIPATAGYIVLAPQIALLFLGPVFREQAALVIPLIALAVFFEGTKHFYIDLSFQLAKRTLLQIWPNLIAACLNVGLNFFLIPYMGILGAVYTAIVSYLLAIMISWLIGRQIFPLPFPYKEILKI
jgi:O-antigen/teichoic acid export membrane protein